MRENGLRGRQKRRFKRTTDSEHGWPIGPNIIDGFYNPARAHVAYEAGIYASLFPG